MGPQLLDLGVFEIATPDSGGCFAGGSDVAETPESPWYAELLAQRGDPKSSTKAADMSIQPGLSGVQSSDLVESADRAHELICMHEDPPLVDLWVFLSPARPLSMNTLTLRGGSWHTKRSAQLGCVLGASNTSLGVPHPLPSGAIG